jgi:Ca-activated chloride channel family protein
MFENIYAFSIIPIYLICKKICKLKKDAIFFPNASISQGIRKKNILEFIIVLFLAISLAAPKTTQTIQEIKKGYDIVIVLDTSGSMAENNKIGIAKSIILNFAKKRLNDRIGLVIFGDIPYIASPLTYNKNILKDILDRIFVNIAGGKTAIIDALFLSTNLFKNSKSKNKIIILITDGKENASITPLDVALKKLKGIKVYSININSAPNNLLQTISTKTNGKYFSINSPNKLQKVFKSIDKLEKSKFKATNIINHYYYQYPLFIALILMSIFIYQFRRESWNF